MRRGSMFVLAGLALALAVAVAGCGSSSSSSSSSSSAPAAAATTSSSAASSTAATSSSTSAAPAPATGGGGTDVHLSSVPGKLAFNTTKLTAKAGKVTMVMANPSSFSHGIAINGHGVNQAGQVVAHGGTSTVTVTLKPGTYTFFCPVPGHEAGGMKGTLTVT